MEMMHIYPLRVHLLQVLLWAEKVVRFTRAVVHFTENGRRGVKKVARFMKAVDPLVRETRLGSPHQTILLVAHFMRAPQGSPSMITNLRDLPSQHRLIT